MARPPLVVQDLLTVEASLLHPETPHAVWLLWTSDQPNGETWRLTTLTRDGNGSTNENGYLNKFELKSFSSLSPITSTQTETADFLKCVRTDVHAHRCSRKAKRWRFGLSFREIPSSNSVYNLLWTYCVTYMCGSTQFIYALVCKVP
jgi:hypothetical protein